MTHQSLRLCSRPTLPLIATALMVMLSGPILAEESSKFEEVQRRVSEYQPESTREKQKLAVLELTLERALSAKQAGANELHDALLFDAMGLLNQTIEERPDPDLSGKLLPKLHTSEKNPYLDALYSWAKKRIEKPDIPFKKAAKRSIPFTGLHHAYGTRDEAVNMNRYFWLATHPQSKYRDNATALAHMLRRAHAYVDAHTTHGIRMQDSTNGHLTNDFFAIGPAVEAMLKAKHAYGDLLLPGDLKRWETMVRQTYDFWMDQYNKNQNGIYRMGRYANRDLAVANILLACGRYLDESEGIEAAKKLVHAQKDNLYPDGAFAYIGTQNESCGYHSACTMFLTRYYHLTGEQIALDLIKASQWYGPLSVEPGNVSDFWTAPSWKHQWNSGFGMGGETVVGVTGNPYERGIMDRHLAKRGASPDPEAAMWYRADVKAKDLPDGYVVMDRNILGPRGRFGRFSYAANLRVPNNDEPGNATLIGAMTTEQDPDRYAYPLEAVLTNIMPRVFVETTPDERHKRPDWAYLSCRDQNAVSVGRDWSAVHSVYQLHSFGSSRKGREVPWQGTQLWIGVRGRLFGLLEIAPIGKQQAFEVALGATLGYGGHGERRPKNLETHGEQHWSLGSLNLRIREHNFNSARVTDTKIRVSKASQITLTTRAKGQRLSHRDKTSQRTDELKAYSHDTPHYAVVEVHSGKAKHVAAVTRHAEGDLLILNVRLNDASYAVLLNKGDQPASVDLRRDGLATKGGWVHFPRNPGVVQPRPLKASLLTVPAGQHRVVLSGLSEELASQSGWTHLEAMINDMASLQDDM